MKTVDSTSRNAFLSLSSTPETRVYVRRTRLDFGSEPIVMASSGLETGAAGEDYYGKFVMGAMSTDSSGGVLRMVNKAAAGQTSDYFCSYTTSPHTASNWTYDDIANSPYSVSAYCRIGAYPAGSGTYYIWYAASSDDKIYRIQYTCGSESWGTPSAAVDVGAWDSIAIHPTGNLEAFIVGFTDPYLWVGRAQPGLAFSKHIVACIPGADFTNHAHFSCASEIGSTGNVAILLNLAPHGAVYSVIYGDGGVFSQPRLAVGANADWGGVQAFTTGCRWINGRMWAVVNRAIESAGEEYQAFHTMLISSPDGMNWREEDFVSVFPCYGSPVVSGDYIYVAGNSVVCEADATIRIGVDNASLLTELDDVTNWSMTQNSNGPGTITLPGITGDNVTVDSGLIEPGAEVQVQARDSSGSWVDIAGGYIEQLTGRTAYAGSATQRKVRGPISRLAGQYAFHHPLGVGYDSPAVWDTNFNSEKGNGKIGVRQVSGQYSLNFDALTGKWELEGERGIALVPTSIRTQWLQMKMHFVPEQSINACYIVFWYEDEDTYWRAGIERDSGETGVDLVIEQVVNGAASTKSISSDVASASNVGQEFTMMLSLRPGYVEVRLNVNSSSEDFITSSDSTSYNLVTPLLEVPTPHHVGIEVGSLSGHEGAIAYGAVESATKSSITDTGVFSTAHVGKWLWYRTQWWRKIVRATSDTAYVIPDFPAKPAVGRDFGVYDENRYPYVRFTNISLCDGNVMWNTGDVAENIMQVAGVNVVDKETTAVSTSWIHAYDIDISLDQACNIKLHATEDGLNYYQVEIDATNSKVTLKRVEGGTPTTIAVHPALIDTSGTGATFRLVHYRDNVYVYCGDHFITSFWGVKTCGYGKVAISTGTGSMPEFPSMVESFIWDAAQPATSAVAKLLRGRPAKMVEVVNGEGDYDNVKVSLFESRDDLGTWSTSVTMTEDGRTHATSLVEMEGEDTREYHIDPGQAREALIFRRAKSEFARGTQQTRSEARRVMRLGKEESRPASVTLALPDLAAMPEDEVTIGSTDYIITGIQYAAGARGNKLIWSARYTMRTKEPVPTAGVWGTDDWGDFKWG